MDARASRVVIRPASAADDAWIHGRYAEADFVAHDPSHDVLIAEAGGVPVGLGRLVPCDAGAVELGGMYVLEGFRGQGVGPALVRALIERAGRARIYCIPWTRLEGMYARHGFRTIEPGADLPAAVADKLRYCAEHYEERVCLMRHFGAPAGDA
jgi:GNAT superfamily N-acetyltransferase